MAFNIGAAVGGLTDGLFTGASNSFSLMNSYYDLQDKYERYRTYMNATQQVREQMGMGGQNRPILPVVPGGGSTGPASPSTPVKVEPLPPLDPNAPTLYPPGQGPKENPPATQPETSAPPPSTTPSESSTRPAIETKDPATQPGYTQAPAPTKFAQSATSQRLAESALGGTSGREGAPSKQELAGAVRGVPAFGGTATSTGREGEQRQASNTPLVYLPPQQFTAQVQSDQDRARRSALVALSGARGYVPYVG